LNDLNDTGEGGRERLRIEAASIEATFLLITESHQQLVHLIMRGANRGWTNQELNRYLQLANEHSRNLRQYDMHRRWFDAARRTSPPTEARSMSDRVTDDRIAESDFEAD
jgi:hypothetical protein